MIIIISPKKKISDPVHYHYMMFLVPYDGAWDLGQSYHFLVTLSFNTDNSTIATMIMVMIMKLVFTGLNPLVTDPKLVIFP